MGGPTLEARGKILQKLFFGKKMKNVNARRVFYLGMYFSIKAVKELNFGRRLGDFGCHLGPSWAPRGSQNRAFWHQVATKVGKMMSRKGCLKKLEILMEF